MSRPYALIVEVLPEPGMSPQLVIVLVKMSFVCCLVIELIFRLGWLNMQSPSR